MLFISEGCAVVTGYQAAQFFGPNALAYRALIIEYDKDEVHRQLNQALQENQPYTIIYRIRTKGGNMRWVREQGQPISSPEGLIEAFEGIITDHHDTMVRLRQLKQRVADRTGRLVALYDILEAVSDTTTLQSTIVRILERVLQTIDVDAGAIHLLDATAENLRLVAQSGLPDMMLESSAMLVLQDSPLVGWVIRHGEPLLIPQVNEDPRATFLSEKSPYTMYAGVPISASDQIFGVLSVLAHEKSRFQAQEEIDLLSSVGEQIGVVVENARLRENAEQLRIIEERSRLARELHDSVTQSLYSVTLFAEAGRRMIAQGDTEQAASYLAEVGETGRQALKEMRLLVHRLRPSILAKEGLVRAIQHRLNAVEGRAGVRSQLLVEGKLELSTAMEEALYYIAQEALNNALKHAAATEVVVLLRTQENGDIELQITDNGRGFEPDKVSELGGLGLTTMYERAELFNGRLTCRSTLGEGTTIQVHMPANQTRVSGRPFKNNMRESQ